MASIRAWVYLQLVITYGKVPYFDKPLLSTADIDNFWDNVNTWVTPDNLAETDVVRKLEEVRAVPYPDYGHYGSTIAYASQCIFPQNLVLADIYLLKASGSHNQADYKKAAKRYYDYLNTEDGGVINPKDFFNIQARNRRTEELSAASVGWLAMFNSKQKVDDKEEVVTVIPSSTNKLWGTVFRGINDLCGFTTSIAVATEGNDTASSTYTSVSLTVNYEHELNPAPGYKRLSMAQDYEMYLGKEGEENLVVVNGAGDSRYKMVVDNYTNTAKGDNTPTEFIVKQLGSGGFSTTYPVIYRKGNIWLRYAEALNGAGFPGYAFAILKNGLCGNTSWLPTDTTQYEAASVKYYDPTEITVNEEGVQDTTFYTGPDLTDLFYHIYLRAYADSAITATTDSLTWEFFSTNIKVEEQGVSRYYFTYNKEGDTDLLFALFEDIWNYFATSNLRRIATSYSEVPNLAYSIICNHIAKREMLAAKDAENASFLNFSTQYLRGSAYNGVMYTRGETEYETMTTTWPERTNETDFTMGIHNRGCGLLKYDEKESTYNYVDQINKMLTTYEGAETPLTREEIYDPNNLDKVQVAVADLILDEMALETAFEGSRFFDLMRYARFRGDNDQLARRVANRGETEDAALRSYLRNTDNWYFKLPQR